MTIALGNSSPVEYAGNGTAVTFSFPWKIFATTDLVVGFITGGVYQLQTTGYTVSGVGVNGGGQVTFTTAPPLNTTVDLRTAVPEIQPTEFANLTAYLPENTTNGMDRLTRALQDVVRQVLTFGFHGPDTELTPWTMLPNASARANTLLGFDSNGLPTVAVPLLNALTQATFNAMYAVTPQSQFNTFLGSSTPYAQTATETTVFGLYGGSVANFFAAVGRPERYTVNTTPGTTDMTSAIQTAYYVIAQTGGRLELTGGPYFVSAPINCTFTGGANQNPVLVRGIGGKDQTYQVIAQHNGVAIFDCTGNDNIIFEDLTIGTAIPTSNLFPQTGILLARNNTGGSLINQLKSVKIVGYFSVACFYNFGSENLLVNGCYFNNFNPAAGARAAVCTANNNAGLSSPFTTIYNPVPTPASTTVIRFTDTDLAINSGTNTSDCLCLDEVASFRASNLWCSANGCRSGVYFDQTYGFSSDCSFIGCSTERAATLPTYAIYFGAAASSMTNVAISIHDCKLYSNASGGAAIGAHDANVTLNGLWVSRISEATSQGLNIPGQLSGQSFLLTGSMVLNIGSGLGAVAAVTGNCVLIGNSANWTFGGNGVDGTSWACNVAPYASGFGTPTGNTITTNFPGATATLLQTSGAVAEILLALKARGILLA